MVYQDQGGARNAREGVQQSRVQDLTQQYNRQTVLVIEEFSVVQDMLNDFYIEPI